MKRKLILYISMSLDGFIAKPGDDLSFLSIVEREGEDYGYADFNSTVDTVIMGRRTYDWVIGMVDEFPHASKNAFIITRTERPQNGNTHFYTGDVKALVHQLKDQAGKHIYCDGGAELVHSLLHDHLIDEMIISVIPIVVGSGIRLFKDDGREQCLDLISARSFESGLVQLHYACRQPKPHA